MENFCYFYLTSLEAWLAKSVKTRQNFGRNKRSAADGTFCVGTGKGPATKGGGRKTWKFVCVNKTFIDDY